MGRFMRKFIIFCNIVVVILFTLSTIGAYPRYMNLTFGYFSGVLFALLNLYFLIWGDKDPIGIFFKRVAVNQEIKLTQSQQKLMELNNEKS